MADLSDEIKKSIVRSLARYDTPSQMAETDVSPAAVLDAPPPLRRQPGFAQAGGQRLDQLRLGEGEEIQERAAAEIGFQFQQPLCHRLCLVGTPRRDQCADLRDAEEAETWVDLDRLGEMRD